jgi:tRNA nucleotidyltransferase/poly(A) polymerase
MLLSAQEIKNKILKDRYNTTIFKKSRGMDLYLVGGYVRDALRGLCSTDRDYIVTNDIRNFVNEIREVINGTIVVFKKGETIRLALKDGLTFDFSKPMGPLEEDLSKRDFTVNAIAWSPHTGIIDPYKGLEDIKKRKIRSLSDKNLISDPLRILRAYRFAAELNGTIEECTRKSIKILHERIKKTSPERITFELFHLLNSGNPSKYLMMALVDGLLKTIFSIPEIILGHNIKEISRLDAKLQKLPKKVKVQLQKLFSQNLTYKGLFRLEVLLLQDKPFISDLFPKIRMGNNIIKRITLTHKGMKKFNKDNLFDIFYESRDSSLDVLILKGRFDLVKEYERFKKIWKKGLLSSLDISRITKIKGQRLGEVIIQLKRAQFERKIKNKYDAKKLLLFILHNISYQTLHMNKDC